MYTNTAKQESAEIISNSYSHATITQPTHD